MCHTCEQQQLKRQLEELQTEHQKLNGVALGMLNKLGSLRQHLVQQDHLIDEVTTAFELDKAGPGTFLNPGLAFIQPWAAKVEQLREERPKLLLAELKARGETQLLAEYRRLLLLAEAEITKLAEQIRSTMTPE